MIYSALITSALVALTSAKGVETNRVLLVPTSTLVPDCATYHGSVSTNIEIGVYNLPSGCQTENKAGVQVEFAGLDKAKLVWVIKTLVDPSITELTARQAEARISASYARRNQITFGSNGPELLISYAGGDLYQVNDDQLRRWTTSSDLTELVVIPSVPLPRPSMISTSSIGSAATTVSKRDTQRIIDQIAGLKFDLSIHTIVESMSIEPMKADLRYLTGENQSNGKQGQTWKSRHSMSSGAIAASHWVMDQFTSYGLNNCTFQHHLPSYSPNVICRIKGTQPENGLVVLGAHYDSRGSFGSLIAPGGDDDASGTSLLLSIARTLHAQPNYSFESDVVLAAFSGEEQGLLGSSFYAQTLLEGAEDVKLMIQSDMLGYRVPGEPKLIGFPDLIGLEEAKFLVGNISALYVPELVVGITPACCSDHQSFNSRGFASTQVFERNGPIADPMYHNTGDVTKRLGYDFDQILAITKVVFASLLETANYSTTT